MEYNQQLFTTMSVSDLSETNGGALGWIIAGTVFGAVIIVSGYYNGREDTKVERGCYPS